MKQLNKFLLTLCEVCMVICLIYSVSEVSASTVKVNLISDVHYDPAYGTSSADGNCNNVSDSPIYGKPGCDAPMDLILSTLDDASSHLSDYTFFAGDFQRHKMSESGLSVNMVFGAVCSMFSSIHTTDNSELNNNFVGTLGNNDVVPDYFFNVSEASHPILQTEINLMQNRKLLSSKEGEVMAKCGYYSRYVSTSLKVIVLHNLVWSYLIKPPISDTESDPCGQFAFLESELAESNSTQQKVIILGHIPPTPDIFKITSNGDFSSLEKDMYWKPQYQQRYTSLIAQYSNIVSLQLYGHTHNFFIHAHEEMHVPLIVSSAVTQIFSNLPSYFIAEFDNETWKLQSLKQQFMTNTNSGLWTSGLEAIQDLQLHDFNNITQLKNDLTNMLTNNATWNNFLQMRTGGRITEPCDTEFCRQVTICAMTNSFYEDIKRCVEPTTTTTTTTTTITTTTTTTTTKSPSNITRPLPIFHVRPETNWINDPNGPIRDPHTGLISLYTQYNPYGALWGNMSWYHYTSTDYVKWKRNPATSGDKPAEGVAITNDKWYTNGGVFSGTMIYNPQGVPTVVYTCVEGTIQRQCVAHPAHDNLDGPFNYSEIVDSPFNPILTENDLPGLVDINNFRDPTEWWVNPANNETYLVAFSARINDETGDNAHVVLFETEDETFERNYHFSHSLFVDPYDPDHMFECPDFYTLPGKADGDNQEHFLKVSTMPPHRDYMYYGSYEPNEEGKYVFVEDQTRSPTFVDCGVLYASKTHYDPIRDRRVLWGWTNEDLVDPKITEQGWSGVMNLPREVHYDYKLKKLRFAPLPELKALRKDHIYAHQPVTLTDAKPLVIAPADGSATLYHEVVATFQVPTEYFNGSRSFKDGKAPEVGLYIRSNDDLSKFTKIAVKMTANNGQPIVRGKEQNNNIAPYKSYSIDDSEPHPPVICMKECIRDRRCVSWTYVADPTNAQCRLHWHIDDFVDSEFVDSAAGLVNEAILTIDRTNSGSVGSASQILGRAPVGIVATNNGMSTITLQVFVDDSVIEAFKDNGAESATGRIYLDNADKQTGVALYQQGMSVPISASADVYSMSTIWDEATS